MGTQRFAGKVVFVTGAGSGIGRATAGAVRRRGRAGSTPWTSIATGWRQTLAGIREAGGRADGQPCDVADMAAVQAAVDAAVAAFGGLDVLCNVAGIGGFKRFEELTAGGLEPHLRGERDRHVPHRARRAAASARRRRSAAS